MSPEKATISQAEKQRKSFAVPGLESVMGTVALRTANNEELHDLFVQNQGLLTDYYHGIFNAATGRGYRRLNKFKRDYQKNPDSPLYNPHLVNRLGFHMSIMRSRVYGPLSKRK